MRIDHTSFRPTLEKAQFCMNVTCDNSETPKEAPNLEMLCFSSSGLKFRKFGALK